MAPRAPSVIAACEGVVAPGRCEFGTEGFRVGRVFFGPSGVVRVEVCDANGCTSSSVTFRKHDAAEDRARSIGLTVGALVHEAEKRTAAPPAGADAAPHLPAAELGAGSPPEPAGYRLSRVEPLVEPGAKGPAIIWSPEALGFVGNGFDGWRGGGSLGVGVMSKLSWLGEGRWLGLRLSGAWSASLASSDAASAQWVSVSAGLRLVQRVGQRIGGAESPLRIELSGGIIQEVLVLRVASQEAALAQRATRTYGGAFAAVDGWVALSTRFAGVVRGMANSTPGQTIRVGNQQLGQNPTPTLTLGVGLAALF